MSDFKTYFNPLVSIARLVLSIIFGGASIIFIYLFFRDFDTNGVKQYLTEIICAIIIGLFFQFFFRALIKTTKTYLIKDDFIKEFNLLTLSSRRIYKDEIYGFSTSIVPYRMWDFKQIIIYLKDGTKIDIMQFSYFNFKKIESVLINKNYNYFGFEPYIWKWFDSRVYSFEEKIKTGYNNK